jgi:hypothetical protein
MTHAPALPLDTADAAGIGHNSGDAFAPKRADIDDRIDAFLRGADIWHARDDLDDDLAARANDFLAGAGKLRSEANKARLAETEPLRKATDAVNAWWAKRIGMIEAIETVIKPKLKRYLDAKAARDRAARDAAERAARDAAARAAAETAAAAAASAPSERIAAAARAEEAEDAAREAAAAAKDLSGPARVGSATGLANRRALRVRREVEVTSLPMAIAYYMRREGGRESLARCVQQMAEAQVRALGVATPLADIAIAGITVTEREDL